MNASEHIAYMYTCILIGVPIYIHMKQTYNQYIPMIPETTRHQTVFLHGKHLLVFYREQSHFYSRLVDGIFLTLLRSPVATQRWCKGYLYIIYYIYWSILYYIVLFCVEFVFYYVALFVFYYVACLCCVCEFVNDVRFHCLDSVTL